jgi:uncharacterized protein (TIGR03435 family)
MMWQFPFYFKNYKPSPSRQEQSDNMRNPLLEVCVVTVMTTASLAKFFPTVRSLILLLASASLHLPSQAQPPSIQPTPPLRFEVASIRPHPFAGDEPSDRRMLPGGRFVATATTVRTFLRIAFGTDAAQISGAPAWVDKELFDINATTINHADITAPEQFQQLILSLLEDRFQLKFHHEEKEAAVYRLELEKAGIPGPALQPSTAESKLNMSVNSDAGRVMNVSKMPMVDIAAALSRQAGRPVEDHTGLKGSFDFEIEWAPEATADSAVPSLFTVLKEQLGLKLQSAKGITRTVVVDQIAQPSAN